MRGYTHNPLAGHAVWASYYGRIVLQGVARPLWIGYPLVASTPAGRVWLLQFYVALLAPHGRKKNIFSGSFDFFFLTLYLPL